MANQTDPEYLEALKKHNVDLHQRYIGAFLEFQKLAARDARKDGITEQDFFKALAAAQAHVMSKLIAQMKSHFNISTNASIEKLVEVLKSNTEKYVADERKRSGLIVPAT